MKTDTQPEGKALYGVGIFDLQVILAEEAPNSWVAQAMEIDYAAGGTTLEDVQTRFEQGLCATIHEHLTVFGDLDKLVVPALPEFWKHLYKAGKVHHYSQVSMHEILTKNKASEECLIPTGFPFGKIDYFKSELAAAHV